MGKRKGIEALAASAGLLVAHMASTESAIAGIDAIEDVLAQMGVPSTPENVAIETQEIGPSDLEIEAAVKSAETQEVIEQIAESAPGGDMVSDPGAAPAVKPAKGKKAKSKKAEATVAPGDAAPEPKKEPKKRIAFANKGERLKHNVGADLGAVCVLETSATALSAQDIAQQEQDTLNIVKGLAVKPQNRATLLLEFAAGKSSKLNEVIKRAFEVLKTDGCITRGDKGNLHANLLSKPYDVKSARAMGNNTVTMLRALKVIQDEPVQKGQPSKLVANPNSALLAKVNAQLGL